MIDMVCDSAVIGLLIPAMRENENIDVIGNASKELAIRLKSGLVELIKVIIPKLNTIEITFSSLVDNVSRSAIGVATGFSGGVDSYSVIHEYLSEHSPAK